MRAALVGIDFGAGDFDASVEELSLLAQSAGAEPITTITPSVPALTPPTSSAAARLTKSPRPAWPRTSNSSSSTTRCRPRSSATSKNASTSACSTAPA
jgi:hypothetical protein